MTLEQQLEYFWERQVYSVLKDSNGKYCIVSTRNHDLGFRFSGFFPTIDIAKDYIGAFGRWENMVSDCILELCTIVDTIHPSELMGKGFRVGDKVKVTGDPCGDIVRTIAERYHYGDGTGVWYRIEGFGEETNFRHEDLKPVLPVEEKTDLEKILGCKLVADEKIPDGVIALVDSKGKVVAAIKDGYIVNL